MCQETYHCPDCGKHQIPNPFGCCPIHTARRIKGDAQAIFTRIENNNDQPEAEYPDTFQIT